MTIDKSRTKTIAVCDDDEGIRRVLNRLLSRHYAVVETSGGKEVLTLIAERCPDLVLLDVAMPELCGLRTLAAYRVTHPFLPTLILTGDHDLEFARRALDLGARAYITKPFHAATLLEEVRRIFESGDREGSCRSMRPPWRLKPAPTV